MDIQAYLNYATKKASEERVAKGLQITLGEAIKQCKAIKEKWSEDELDNVVFDFAECIPVSLDSWRGVYAELALSYDIHNYEANTKPLTLAEFTTMLEEAVGKTFTGWKGGEFLMDESTPLWVANAGHSGNTAVTAIVYDGYYSVVVMTQYQEI